MAARVNNSWRSSNCFNTSRHQNSMVIAIARQQPDAFLGRCKVLRVGGVADVDPAGVDHLEDGVVAQIVRARSAAFAARAGRGRTDRP